MKPATLSFVLFGVIILILALFVGRAYFPFSRESGDEIVPFIESTVFPGDIAFGPETFVSTTGEIVVITRSFSVANPDADYFIQIQNGDYGGTGRVKNAVIKLNGETIVFSDEIDQEIFGSSKDVLLQKNNSLALELFGDPSSTLTVTIRRKMLNPTVSNSKNDLLGSNDLESIGLWWDREERATEYVLFRSESINGPFVEIGTLPAGLQRRTNATDFTPDALIKTLCYKIEALDDKGTVIRVYEPVCIPKFER